MKASLVSTSSSVEALAPTSGSTRASGAASDMVVLVAAPGRSKTGTDKEMSIPPRAGGSLARRAPDRADARAGRESGCG